MNMDIEKNKKEEIRVYAVRMVMFRMCDKRYKVKYTARMLVELEKQRTKHFRTQSNGLYTYMYAFNASTTQMRAMRAMSALSVNRRDRQRTVEYVHEQHY